MVPRRGRDGARIHQHDAGELAARGLGAFAVREVARRMADGERVVARHVARAEARAAEARLEERARLEQRLLDAVFHQLQIDRDGRRIDGEGEIAVTNALAVENGRGFGDVVVHAAGAACDDALIDEELPIFQLVGEMQLHLAAELLMREQLGLAEDVRAVRLHVAHRERAGGVERHGDHRLDLREVDLDDAVVEGAFFGFKLLIGFRAAVDGEVFLNLLIRLPDGGEAGRLGGHDVDADAVVHREAGDAGSGELQNFIFDEAAVVDCAAERDGDVLRADAAGGLARQVDEDDVRHGDVVGVGEELLDDLRAALADAHRAERAVARVAVGAEDHPAAAGHHLARVLVDDGLIGRDVDAAVFLRGGEAEDMVVLVDRAADGAEAVMTVRHHVGHRERRQAAGPRRLDDADVSDIM